MTAMACQICRRLLNHHTDLTTGDRTWRHPASAGRPDHDPQPVPADTVAADYHCDFCSDPNVVYVYRTGAVDAHFIGDDHHQVHRYGTEWAACITCSPLVEARDATALAARAQAAIPARLTKDARDALLRLQQTIVDSLHPGRALTAVGKWEPTPVPAPILPKVRDRLTALLRGPDRLPANLNPTSRGELADGMVAARLYWIDPEFTDLTRHASSALPDTALENADLPAPHGLLAWATPLGALVATSWTSTGTGILVAGYRSIGAGLQGAALQRLREQVGWLIPTWCSRISDGEMVTRSDPAGPLAATLLLIAQQLAHTAAAPVDERIRKAYRRSRRQEPEVQLVRIRGSNSTARAGDHSAAHAGVAAGREYRWWVRGHWRQQPYGPGRTQRRLIYINPQLRGPQDKPIKPTTTVRILGRHDLKS